MLQLCGQQHMSVLLESNGHQEMILVPLCCPAVFCSAVHVIVLRLDAKGAVQRVPAVPQGVAGPPPSLPPEFSASDVSVAVMLCLFFAGWMPKGQYRGRQLYPLVGQDPHPSLSPEPLIYLLLFCCVLSCAGHCAAVGCQRGSTEGTSYTPRRGRTPSQPHRGLP